MTTGEGGAVTTGSEEEYELLVSLRNQGRLETSSWLQHGRFGFNYRLDDISAALGIGQLEKLDRILEARSEVAARYAELLAGVDVELPLADDDDHVRSWFVYVVKLPRGRRPRRRDRATREQRASPAAPYLPSIHLQSYMRERFGFSEGMFPVSEDCSARTMAIPFHARLARRGSGARRRALRAALAALLNRSFFARDVHEVARELIGAELYVDGVGGTIVEVEAYDRPTTRPRTRSAADDRAERGDVRPAGHAYVYRSYGIHWCLNLVCEDEGVGERDPPPRARADRGARGDAGAARGSSRRRVSCAPGPGRLCQALGVTARARRAAARPAAVRARAARGAGRDRDRPADRDHEGRRSAVALRARRLALPQPAVPGRLRRALTVSVDAASRAPRRGPSAASARRPARSARP